MLLAASECSVEAGAVASARRAGDAKMGREEGKPCIAVGSDG